MVTVVVLCDDYVALKLKFSVDIIDLVYKINDHPCMSLCSCHCRNGHLEVVKLLLMNSKPDVNSKDNSGWTPLHLACS